MSLPTGSTTRADAPRLPVLDRCLPVRILTAMAAGPVLGTMPVYCVPL